MGVTSADLPVENNEAANRFEIRIGDATALLEYRIRDRHVVLLHTEVPRQFTGQGIGGKLVQAALDFAKASGFSVVPRCSFVVDYIAKHPEYASMVKAESRPIPPSS